MTERYEYDIKYNSGIRDWSGTLDFDYVPTPQHLIKFGAEYVFHTFIPETVSLITATMEYGGEPVNSKMDLSKTDSYTGHRLETISLSIPEYMLPYSQQMERTISVFNPEYRPNYPLTMEYR